MLDVAAPLASGAVKAVLLAGHLCIWAIMAAKVVVARPSARRARSGTRAPARRRGPVPRWCGSRSPRRRCRSGVVSVPCTGYMIAQVVNEALDARDLRRAAAGVIPL